ncbi:VanW family protein [Ornithinimicrobium sp. Y1847]|uniref:VanW family protein n=1 Tax=Ornithinimicrobium sp. Y1847 TaxID=3405419 RepID=UPI003B67FFFA
MSDGTRGTQGGAGAAGLSEEPKRGAGWEWAAVLGRLLVVLLVLGAVYVGAALYFQDRPPAGISVQGVEIGSLPHEEAVAHLESRLADEAAEPVLVRVVPAGEGADGAEPVEFELEPEAAGLTYDIESTLDGITGFSLDPRDLWSHIVGSERELPLIGAVDRELLTAAVQAEADAYDEDPVEGEVTIEQGGGGVQVVNAEEGRTLDVERTVDAVEAAWPLERTADGSAELIAPQLSQAEIDRFTTEEVEPALAGPIEVVASRGSGSSDTTTAELAPREIAALLTIERAEDNSLTLEIDDEALLARLRQDLGQLERGPSEPTVRLGSTGVEVVRGSSGSELDDEDLVEKARGAILASGEDRTVESELSKIFPAVSNASAELWVFETMGSFDSQFPTGETNRDRTANLHTGIGHVNGTVVMPGEQFALSAALGPITKEAGYHEAPVIVDGRLVQGMGGGLSQVSTVVFNTSWASGVQLDAHTPHSYYISRYPAGREATLAIPVIDNLWTNDTDNPVVVRSWISGDVIHMEFLGKRQYTVQTVDGPRTNVTQGEKHVVETEGCVPQRAADGFTITNTRILSRGGTEVKRDQFTTTYHPADEIECTNPIPGY